ncbi:hypothetical protein GH733_019296 [Mirounga leonina]|nr:hypothetical protein GH733_019296 [Mirounga leonina]
MSYHVRSHDGAVHKPYHCSHCGRSFSRPDPLNTHVTQVHSTERPFKCEKCEAAFATKDRLRAQPVRPEEEVPCHVCGKMLSSAYISDPMTVHSQGPHHVCELCNKGTGKKKHQFGTSLRITHKHIKMAVPKTAIPSLSECQCLICLEILIEPVTLPCNHTLCNPCFQSTVEKASLCCPFCRRWISSWTRYHTRRNSLVNMELWELIQKHYPKECALRISGQESEEIVDDCQPVRLLSRPGELRREYEEEISKMEAERRASEEEENKASEEYIQRLLAEEEEEEKRQAEKRRREMEEQLKSDEELARKLSININNFCDASVLASPSNSRKSATVTTKSQKKSKNKQTNTGDIHKYLSPKSQFESASQFEIVQERRKHSTSKETDSSVVKSPTWQDTEIEEDMPTLSQQICVEIQEQGEKSSESPMPQLCANGGEWCLEGEVKVRPTNDDKELSVLNHEAPEGRVPCSGEAAVKPYGKTESGCPISGMTQKFGSNTAETENEESCPSISKHTSKRKNPESLKQSGIHAFLQKEGKCSPKLPQIKRKPKPTLPQN